MLLFFDLAFIVLLESMIQYLYLHLENSQTLPLQIILFIILFFLSSWNFNSQKLKISTLSQVSLPFLYFLFSLSPCASFSVFFSDLTYSLSLMMLSPFDELLISVIVFFGFRNSVFKIFSSLQKTFHLISSLEHIQHHIFQVCSQQFQFLLTFPLFFQSIDFKYIIVSLYAYFLK